MYSFFSSKLKTLDELENFRKIILLVGGNGYVGRSLLERISSKKDFLFVVVSRNANLKGDNILSVPIDITKDVESSVSRILMLVERVDVIVHLAATYYFETSENLSQEAMLREYDVNTIAPLLLTQAVNQKYWISEGVDKNLSHNRKVIVVGSQAGEGRTKRENLVSYSATKAALRVAWDYYGPFLKKHGVETVFLKPGSLREKKDLDDFVYLLQSSILK